MFILCTNCCRPVAATSITPGERHSWCPNCNRIFRVPLFYVPEWILGIVAILAINLLVNM